MPDQLSADLSENLNRLFATHQMHKAGIGNAPVIVKDALFRTDQIYWLDRKHNDAFENAFFDIMDAFIVHLNNTCYTGITSYEFHYTLYEKDSFYKKHLDQFRNSDSRRFSMIFYLNADWKTGDGGELCVYHDDLVQIIEPLNGRMVFFKSNELPHEVLVTHKPRLSITGWLKKD